MGSWGHQRHPTLNDETKKLSLCCGLSGVAGSGLAFPGVFLALKK